MYWRQPPSLGQLKMLGWGGVLYRCTTCLSPQEVVHSLMNLSFLRPFCHRALFAVGAAISMGLFLGCVRHIYSTYTLLHICTTSTPTHALHQLGMPSRTPNFHLLQAFTHPPSSRSTSCSASPPLRPWATSQLRSRPLASPQVSSVPSLTPPLPLPQTPPHAHARPPCLSQLFTYSSFLGVHVFASVRQSS
jgi:hypothetical protein